MKIRIKGNTVRYRLAKSEVILLAANGMLEEQTVFPGTTLHYAIRETAEADLTAEFNSDTITLFVPKSALQKWSDSDLVGLEGSVMLPNGDTLHLLLEKDFKCIDSGVKEDQADYFENPQLTC